VVVDIALSGHQHNLNAAFALLQKALHLLAYLQYQRAMSVGERAREREERGR
jgi:hypothetical protein